VSPPPAALLTRFGRRVLDVLPPSLENRAWLGLQTVNIAVFRGTRGRFGSGSGRARLLLLHHVGRKSSQARVSPLLYVADGPRLAIIASKGGNTRHPAWYHNLVAHPDTEVELPGERRLVRARVAVGEERDRIWTKAAEVWPDYNSYQERTDREIPIVVLDPR
jgi:deazaflavin-dependent oxidoreductase (nitroreductase family)